MENGVRGMERTGPQRCQRSQIQKKTLSVSLQKTDFIIYLNKFFFRHVRKQKAEGKGRLSRIGI